jgi:hypothetical protein
MKRMRMMGLCLVAAVALAAVAASAASAVTYQQPVFYGKAAIGSVVQPVKFTGTVGEANLETSPAHSVVKCTGGTATGEVTTSTLSKKNITTFTGCTLSGFKCESGAIEGQIVTASLEGQLGQIATSGKVGIKLKPEVGTEFAAFSCDGGATPVKVKGGTLSGDGVIGEASGASGGVTGAPEGGVQEAKFGTTTKLTFKSKAIGSGLQIIQKFDTDTENFNLEASLKGAAYELSSQAAVATLKAEGIGSNLGVTK